MKNFKVFIAVVALGLLAACANKENEPKIYTVDELSSIMGQLVDSTINVQGVAKHSICISKYGYQLWSKYIAEYTHEQQEQGGKCHGKQVRCSYPVKQFSSIVEPAYGLEALSKT